MLTYSVRKIVLEWVKKTQRVWLVDKIEDQIWSGDTGCPAHFAHAYILMYDHWRVNYVIWFMI